MNKLTEALSKQAAEYAIEFAVKDQEQYIPKLMEKFAELIVRECVRIAKTTEDDDDGEYKSGRYWAGKDILEHFGVE